MNRYSRQTILPEIGEAGQQALHRTRLLVVGAGGLGCPLLQYVVGAGIGTVQVVDSDVVQLSNLQRQILFTEADVGRPKAVVAVERLKALNSTCQLRAAVARFSAEQAQDWFDEVDIVVDCTDDMTTKYALSDACWRGKKPLVSASLRGFQGQLIVYDFLSSPSAPCMQCIFPKSTSYLLPSCVDNGVLGAVAGIIGAMQGLAVIRYAIGHRVPADGHTLFVVNALDNEILRYGLAKDAMCEGCYTRK